MKHRRANLGQRCIRILTLSLLCFYPRSSPWAHPERQAGANSFRFPSVTKTLGPGSVHPGDLAHVARWTPFPVALGRSDCFRLLYLYGIFRSMIGNLKTEEF